MKKQNISRVAVLMFLLLAFVYTQAGFVPIVTTTPTCYGNDGTVTITGTGDPGPFYIYIYGNGIYEADSNVVSSSSFTGLPSGIYSYTMGASDSAYQPGTFTIGSVITVTIATAQPICPHNTVGVAELNVLGGAMPYIYHWSNGATTQTVLNLPLGPNSVTVTDQNGCSVTTQDTVYITSEIRDSIVHSGSICAGGLTVDPYNGTAPYMFVWSNGATSQTIAGLTNGVQYSVSITDANGCQWRDVGYISNSSLQFDSLHTQLTEPSCGANGSISVAMASGTAPYNYLWSNGATGATITGLAQGFYLVTATDANGCTGQGNYFLYSNALAQSIVVQNPACGTTSGYIQLYAGGGTAPYSFSFSNGITNANGFDTILPAGTYNYTVSDAAGCTITDSVKLIPQGNFTAQITVMPIICPSTSGGSITATVTGGGPYNYLWSNGATTQTVNNVPDGVYYSLTVTDGNGCETEAISDSVSTVAPFTVSLTSPACSTTITASVTGGNTGPYNYLWSSGQTTATITFTQFNTYSVTVTDAHGCAGSQYAYIYSWGITLDSNNSVVNPTCTSSGSIRSIPLNGVAPYSYAWSNGATTDSIEGLSSGYYQVTVTDANGCTGVGYYYLSENTIWANTVNYNPACGSATGVITINASNGTQPYNYYWSNSSTNHTNVASSLGSGIYYYTVTDAAGCSFSDSDFLTANASYIANISPSSTSCNSNVATGGVLVTITNGGTAPFTFNWQIWDNNSYNYIDTTTTGGLTGLSYGSIVWLLSVTDANGCVDSLVNYTGTDSAGAYINYAASCYNDITGYAYTDINGNCAKDAGEPGVAGINVVATGTNGQGYYAVADSNGFYDIQVLAGNYTVTAYTYNYGTCAASTCTSSYNATFATSGGVSSGNNFGFSNTSSFDLAVHTGYDPSWPGSTKEYWVYYYNQGNATANNAALTFVHDPNLTLISTTPNYSSYNQATQTITWNLGTVPVSQGINWGQQVTMEFNVPSNLPLGTLLSAYDSITPTVGDCNPGNNVQFLQDVVTASHDPNAKEVSPSTIAAGDSVLNYTIRFQNTGNAAATKVVIVDTLSPLVNPASLVAGASNFPYTYTLTGNGILTFTFYPIHLLDSTQSADSSKGFVSYSVNVRGGTGVGAQVKNTAYIYFDFNPAIVTNTTVSTVTESSVGFKTISAGNMSVSVSPNPVHDKSLFTIEGATGEVSFKLDDIAGQKMFEKTTSEPTIVFESEAFAAGVYIYTARDAKGNTCTGKIVIAR